MKFGIIITLYLFFWISCAPYVKYQVVEASRVAKSPEYNISIYHELDPLPPQSRVMGELRIDNAVPSMVNCGYLDIVKLAKWKVRKVGGDALQITKITLPDETNNCYGIKANVITFNPFGSIFWPSINIEENNFKEYFHENVLDPIEGIWTITENTDWENILTGVKGNNEVAGKFEIAIIRDDNIYDRYNAYILNSKQSEWPRGRMKAYYTKTGHKLTYEEHWYYVDHTEKVRNILIEDSGVYRTSSTFSKYPVNYNRENIALRAYPPHYMYAHGLVLSTQLQSMGSGFVISGNGLIITNYHVIRGKDEIDVYFPSIDKSFTANIALEDQNNDIALLALEDFHISKYFTKDIPFILSSTKDMRLG